MGNFQNMMQHEVQWEGNTFLQYPHSIIDWSPFGPGILLIFEHSQREFKESKLLEFFWDKVDIVGMVEFDWEDIMISFSGALLEFSKVEFDEVFSELKYMLLAH